MPDLAVRDLVVRTAAGRTILDLPSFHVAAGEAVGIEGPSGAGKSTLLHALSGLLVPARGAVRWGTIEITALAETARDRFRLDTLGLIFQEFLLFDELSALDNAAIAAAYSNRQARKRLRARAAELLGHLGISTDGRNVSSFSGGERQRVAVARALATDPAVILADEPTASLDRDNADRLVADLLTLARDHGRTVIAVTHDASVLAAMDRRIRLVDGRTSEP